MIRPIGHPMQPIRRGSMGITPKGTSSLTRFHPPPIWGYERATPRYPLGTIKAAFADVSRLNRTMTAAEGAEDLGMDEQAVVDVIAGLTIQDFDKSMQSDRDPVVRQDVYKPIVDGRELYVKITQDTQGGLLLISFKENDE